jgi:hypothetical protein
VKSVAFNPNGWKIEKIGRAAGSLWSFAVFWVRLKSNRNISTEPLALCLCEPLAVSSFPSPIGTTDIAAVDFNPLQVLG